MLASVVVTPRSPSGPAVRKNSFVFSGIFSLAWPRERPPDANPETIVVERRSAAKPAVGAGSQLQARVGFRGTEFHDLRRRLLLFAPQKLRFRCRFPVRARG